MSDDGMVEGLVLPPDEPPKNGIWVDVHDILANPTPDEVIAGREQGLRVYEEGDVLDSRLRAAATSRSLDAANALARHIRAVARVEVSIELVQGRPTSNPDPWYNPNFLLNFGHHVVSSYSSSNLTPGLALVKKGRSDVPGPLCNGYGGYDLTYRIICFGLANHPGAGGPYTLRRNGAVIPVDSARPYTWGTEWEGGISYSDWTKVLRNPRQGYSMTMLEFMGRVDAALNSYKGWPKGEFWILDQMEHKTWTGRKIDRLQNSRTWWQDNARKYTGTPQEEDMPLTQDDLNKITHAVWGMGGRNTVRRRNPDGTYVEVPALQDMANGTTWVEQVFNQFLNTARAYGGVTVIDRQKQILAALAQFNPEAMTAAIRQAAEEALADVNVSVDTDALVTAIADRLSLKFQVGGDTPANPQ